MTLHNDMILSTLSISSRGNSIPMEMYSLPVHIVRIAQSKRIVNFSKLLQ